MNKLHKLQLPFVESYKHAFLFSDGEHSLYFVPEYRSSVNTTMSVEDAIKEGCEYITFDGEDVE